MLKKIIYTISLLFILVLPMPSHGYSQAQQEAMSGMVVPAALLEGQEVKSAVSQPAGSQDVSRSTTGSSDYQKVFKTAMSLLGKPYRYGADGPDSFDCSGYVMYVFKTVGIDLPHLASDQANYGIPVDKENLKPGDLVFFSYYQGKGIEHSGIYIGESRFIHASSSKKSVVISEIDSNYYSSNYKGARRLIR
ncbi:MAG: C40 family peptidase [Bacillota bacterium]